MRLLRQVIHAEMLVGVAFEVVPMFGDIYLPHYLFGFETCDFAKYIMHKESPSLKDALLSRIGKSDNLLSETEICFMR